MDHYGKSKELAHKFQDCIRTYADMLGAVDTSKSGTYGFVPGLQRTLTAEALEKQLAKLQEGIFQVLFTGGFSAGKSTLLNSIMHRPVLRMDIKAETAVITKIIFGMPESVSVFKKKTDNDSGEPQVIKMSLGKFFEEYRVDEDNPDKFLSIDHVVIYQPGGGIGGTLVQLVDSPGTEHSSADTLIAREFAEHASAIVHLINSTMPFAIEDKEYIRTHYANRHMKNIFFVCNRFDSLNEEAQEALRDSAIRQLRDVFTDENGQFDEELFSRRVFYTDAYHSLKARTGEKVKTPFGMMECDDSVTGVPEFEEGLSSYLTDEDRDKEAFRGYIPQLAGRYLEALDEIHEILTRYKQGADDLLAKQSDLEGKKDKLESIIEQIEDSCRNCAAGILTSARGEYYSCMSRIDSGWDSHFSKIDIPFGITDMISLAWNRKNDKKVQEITKPFADAVQSYVMSKFDGMFTNLKASIESEFTKLERQLNIQQKMLNSLELPISVDSLRQALLGSIPGMNNPKVKAGEMEGASIFQIILGIIGVAPDILVGGIDGRTSNVEALFKFLFKNVFEYIAWYVVAWPIGIGMIIARIWNIIKGIKNTKTTKAQKILLDMKKNTVDALKAEQDRYIREIETKLAKLTEAGRIMANGVRTQVRDYETSLKTTIAQLKSQKDIIKTETDRTDKIKARLLGSLSEVNVMLNGSPLSEEQIRELAVRN